MPPAPASRPCLPETGSPSRLLQGRCWLLSPASVLPAPPALCRLQTKPAAQGRVVASHAALCPLPGEHSHTVGCEGSTRGQGWCRGWGRCMQAGKRGLTLQHDAGAAAFVPCRWQSPFCIRHSSLWRMPACSRSLTVAWQGFLLRPTARFPAPHQHCRLHKTCSAQRGHFPAQPGHRATRGCAGRSCHER